MTATPAATVPLSPAPDSTATRPQRLLSIDALRGFDMFWIIGGDALFRALGRYFGEPAEGILATQLEHVEWAGFRFYDLIFPLFLFLVGVVIPFSMDKFRRQGVGTGAMLIRIGRRVALLFLLGLINNDLFDLDFAGMRYAGVLQRIGICYGIAALIAWFTGPRVQAALAVVILLGYWAVLATVAAPGGVAGDYTKTGNLAGYIDRTYLPGKILEPYYGDGDNEGLLSTIPAIATALLGVLAGHWLRAEQDPRRRVGGLALAGAACLAAGSFWSWKFPIIKNIWTSSFVLFAGGLSLLLLAAFHQIIDVWGYRRWAFPFAVIGANAITIYVVPRFVDFEHMAGFFLGGTARLAGDLGPIILLAGTLLAQWLFLYYLYRRGIFLRA